MILRSRRWGPHTADAVVCIHGIAQHGEIFKWLAESLVECGHGVLAVDLRGHGESGREPPWNVATHAADVTETLAACGVTRANWVGHSFGARIVAELAAGERPATRRVAMLEPVHLVEPGQALQRAELERLDWSFESEDGAVNALLGSGAVVAAPRRRVADFVHTDLCRGPDGRFRFGFSPAAVVTAWSEMTLPPPPVAGVPTLIVRAAAGTAGREVERRYAEALGDRFSVVEVPHGHNVLWDAPEETIAAVTAFI